MARRSKKKGPSREDHPRREHVKIEEGVFGGKTMQNMRKFFTRNIISQLEFIISTGKEADVYLARHGDAITEEFVALKIFRVENAGFLNRIDYVVGDPRFGKIKTDIYNVTNTWCKKEFGNLRLAWNSGVNVPKPYSFAGNILAMEFVGSDEGVSAPQLRQTKLEGPEEVLEKIIKNMKKLYVVGLVHSDLSEYNILMVEGEEPVFIDMGQAVMLGHPKFRSFLERDVINILYYFRKHYKVDRDYEKVVEEIIASRG